MSDTFHPCSICKKSSPSFDPCECKTENNTWDFDKENREQVNEFLHHVKSSLSEVQQRMLLCLIGCENGRAALVSGLYK